METSQMLIYLVIVIQVLLVVTTIYFYLSHKLRLFIFLGLGFIALLAASVVQAALSGTDTGVYVSLLQAGAGLFFLSGVLSTM
jgi:NAD/NADP transhydrogenase beta subunit